MKYLIRKHGSKNAAHIWNGNDTECRMFSTLGLGRGKFGIHDSSNGRKICRMCHINYNKKLTGVQEPNVPKKPKYKRKHKRSRKNDDGFYKSKEWRRLRYQALKLHGNQCLCCGAKPPFVVLHVDHIKPRSRYPELELDINNLQVLCEDCNLGKSNKDTIDYRCKDEEIDEVLDRMTLANSPI